MGQESCGRGDCRASDVGGRFQRDFASRQEKEEDVYIGEDSK